MSDEYIQLCRDYLDSLDKDIDEEELEELEARIGELEEEREEYLESYGEDDVLVERVEEEINELQSQLEDIQNAVSRADELRDKVLEKTTSQFIAEGKYLDEDVLEALNHALTNKREATLRIEDWEITPDVEIEEGVRRISHVIRKLALARSEGDTDLEESWESIEGSTKHEPFLVLAEAGEALSPSAVAEQIDEDVDTSTMGTRLRNTIHQLEYTPYHRIEGDYMVSTVGEVMSREYGGELIEETVAKDGEKVESDDNDEEEKQTTLDATSENDD